jgi:hypothetical protein
MEIMTFLEATPPTDSESDHIITWEVLHQCLLLHGRLLNMDNHHRSCKPELYQHLSGIHVVLSAYWNQHIQQIKEWQFLQPLR